MKADVIFNTYEYYNHLNSVVFQSLSDIKSVISDSSDESLDGALGTVKSSLVKEVTTLNRRQGMVAMYHVS